ncbi:hypothetical protein CRG98_014943 [Punica granatum]|uniref:DUF7745 domain-containing protein n=1 Tax=Punica granatum TaxID=22663 RepID=A0A2I0K7Y7_PUNGR|nr:hypothetical protein CRG98_014943 [Punica granatum]
MSHSVSCPRLERITPPIEEITYIWTTLRRVDRDYITTFIEDVPLLATRNVDWNFLEAAITFWNPDHVVFNIQGNELTPTIEQYRILIGHTMSANDIVRPNFCTTRPTLVSRLLEACKVQGNFLRKDLCHAFLLLIFGTILFPRSRALIDAAFASVVLQVVGGHGYEVALMAETVQSLDRVLRTRDRRIRGSPILLQIWLQSHAYPFGLVHPVMYFANQESIISRLLPFVRVEEHKINEWMKVFREMSPRSFKWRAAWMPLRPMALKCADFYGIPLISHAGSTTYFLARDEQDFQATEEYVLRFHRWGPPVQEDTSRPADQASPGTPSMAIQIELASLTAKRDYLRQEVAEKDKQLIDQHQLQKELAQARTELQRRDQELARVNIALEKSRKRARGQPYPL